MGVNLRESDEVLLDPADALVHLAGKAHDVKKVSAPQEYFAGNTDLTKTVFDHFLASEASVFVFMSSIKSACTKAVLAASFYNVKFF